MNIYKGIKEQKWVNIYLLFPDTGSLLNAQHSRPCYLMHISYPVSDGTTPLTTKQKSQALVYHDSKMLIIY